MTSPLNNLTPADKIQKPAEAQQLDHSTVQAEFRVHKHRLLTWSWVLSLTVIVESWAGSIRRGRRGWNLKQANCLPNIGQYNSFLSVFSVSPIPRWTRPNCRDQTQFRRSALSDSCIIQGQYEEVEEETIKDVSIRTLQCSVRCKWCILQWPTLPRTHWQ